MILTRIYASFGENHSKLRYSKSISTTRNRTRHLPSTSFESRTGPPLVGRENRKENRRSTDRICRIGNFVSCIHFFKTNLKKNWLWRSPSGGISEIGCVLTYKKQTVVDCAMINRFSSGCDHRLQGNTSSCIGKLKLVQIKKRQEN